MHVCIRDGRSEGCDKGKNEMKQKTRRKIKGTRSSLSSARIILFCFLISAGERIEKSLRILAASAPIHPKNKTNREHNNNNNNNDHYMIPTKNDKSIKK